MNELSSKVCRFCNKELVVVDEKCQNCGADYPSEKIYAGFLKRFCALMIDSLIIFAVFMLVGICVAVVMAVSVPKEDYVLYLTALQKKINIVSFFASWLYYALMESSPYQATLGKRIMRIKVSDLQGNRISFARATGRYFGKIVSTFSLFIGFLMAAFTVKKQALHDMIAETLVVNGK